MASIHCELVFDDGAIEGRWYSFGKTKENTIAVCKNLANSGLIKKEGAKLTAIYLLERQEKIKIWGSKDESKVR